MSNTGPSHTGFLLDARPKPFVFVLMPFDKAFTDVYQLGIKTACEKAGAYAQRLDEQLFAESMLQRIYNQIDKADVIIADMTGRNPNVFYEVGYAHALGKAVILLTQADDDIPFDLKHYRHIIYQNVTTLLPDLEAAVRWAIAEAAEKRPGKTPLEIHCYGMPLVGCPTIPACCELRGHTRTTRVLMGGLLLAYGNTDEIHAVKCRMALWASQSCDSCRWEPQSSLVGPVAHPSGRKIFLCPTLMSLLPGEWRSDEIELQLVVADERGNDFTEHFVLRVSTETGSYDYPFIAEFNC